MLQNAIAKSIRFYDVHKLEIKHVQSPFLNRKCPFHEKHLLSQLVVHVLIKVFSATRASLVFTI